MYDAITPAQWVIGLTISLIVMTTLGAVLFWTTMPPEDKAHIMSRLRRREAVADRSDASVHVPVQPNQYAEGTTAPPPTAMDADLPDTDGPNGGTDWQPRLPRYPTERELIVYLATIRDRSGKHLRSANQIAQFSALHRNEVLKIVREVREGVPQYPAPLTDSQTETRRELALDN